MESFGIPSRAELAQADEQHSRPALFGLTRRLQNTPFNLRTARRIRGQCSPLTAQGPGCRKNSSTTKEGPGAAPLGTGGGPHVALDSHRRSPLGPHFSCTSQANDGAGCTIFLHLVRGRGQTHPRRLRVLAARGRAGARGASGKGRWQRRPRKHTTESICRRCFRAYQVWLPLVFQPCWSLPPAVAGSWHLTSARGDPHPRPAPIARQLGAAVRTRQALYIVK